MSYAINREEIRDVVFLGTGVPRQAAPNEDCSFYKEEWANFCVEYDPDKANALLDEMGLDKRDANGYRLRPDGKTLSIRVDYTTNIDSPAEDVLVLVAQYWEDVGVKVEYKELERDLLFERGQSNGVQVSVWHTDRTNESRIYVPAVGKIVADSIQGEVPGTNEYYRWHSTNGEEGIEPPDDWKEHFKDIDAWHSATSKQEYDRLAKKIFDFCILQHLRVIGTVGFTAWPVIVKLDMGNIPPAGSFMGDDVGFIRGLRPETWYRK
jgi:peptide/nickel transport system substrate-binding protein